MLLILRVKRCQAALAGGRLDEALGLMAAADLRAHARGQELVDGLLAALLKRSREHLAAGRLAGAEEDCRKAIGLAGNTSEGAQLLTEIANATATERDRIGRREQVGAAVRQMVQAGNLTRGEAYVAQAIAGGDGADGRILADIAQRRADFDRSIAGAAAAIARRDWDSAISLLSRAASLRPNASEFQALSKSLADAVAAEAQSLAEAGRLGEASALLARITPFQNGHLQLRQLRGSLDQCRRAWDLVRQERPGEAAEILSRLSVVWSDAAWIHSTVAELSDAGAAMSAVRRGPLGLLDSDATLAASVRPAPPMIRSEPAPVRARPTLRRFLLHVDGAGSYVVIRGDAIDIGPVRASRPPDLPLMTAPTAPRITLSRSEEDYFLNAARQTVMVNDRRVSSALLTNGDRIGIGPRCRIEFRRPNQASASAVLMVSGARLPWGGVREVLLMDRELILGPSASAHVRTRDSTVQLVLQADEEGRILGRASEAIAVDGQTRDRVTEIAMGARVTVGNLSLVLQES